MVRARVHQRHGRVNDHCALGISHCSAEGTSKLRLDQRVNVTMLTISSATWTARLGRLMESPRIKRVLFVQCKL